MFSCGRGCWTWPCGRCRAVGCHGGTNFDLTPLTSSEGTNVVQKGESQVAFRKDKTGIAQSAVKAASEMTAALVTAGIITDASTARMFFEETRSSIYAELEPVVDADNETFAAAEAAEGGSRKSSGGSRSGGARRSGGGGNSRSISFEDASNLELNSGSFKGCTIAEVYELSASECEDYDYGDGDKTGAQYVRWLASDKNQNSFTRARAAVFLEGVE